MKKITLALSILAISVSARAVTNEEHDKMQSLLKASAPYTPGFGKSAFDACQSMANDMVKKHGDKMSQQGVSPNEIRESSLQICVDVNSQAENAQSVDEVDMWKQSITRKINQDLNENKQSPVQIELITEVIDWSAKIARPIYYMRSLENHSHGDN